MDNSPVEAGSRFLASTLHEIRTPIQTIISTTELLEDTPMNPEQTEYVRQIQFSANVLLQLANDVLDFTKIRSKEFRLENIPFNVIEVTERVVDLVSIEAFNRGLEVITDIDYSIPKTIMGDPTRYQQILLNLVKNAVKFTSRGYILVKLRESEGSLTFQVIDSGIGIAQDKQPLIFNDFFQVDASTTRKYGGTGLGLSICKNLVSVMKGQIGVKDNPHGGSIFWFTVPYEKADLNNEESDIIPSIPEKTKILIVDDNKGAALSLKYKFSAFGLSNIEIAQTAESGVVLLNQAAADGEPFTMAFIDMLMPKIDGWKLSQAIRSLKEIPKPALYLLVPEGQMGKDAKLKMQNRFDGYLYKPVKREHLKKLLTNIFSTEEDKDFYQIEKDESIIPMVEDSLIAKGIKVLVAEDHPVNRKLMNTFLTKFGAQVFLAEDGQKAIEQVEEHPEIDIIFMDIQMPVKNGTDATWELRQKHFKGIIIACTANSDPKDFRNYRRLGINDILVKPFKKEAIKQVLLKWHEVLSVPEAKDIMILADMNSKALDLWDTMDYLDTVSGDTNMAVKIIDDYMTQTTQILTEIKAEIKKDLIDTDTILRQVHTLKGSSKAISASKLSNDASRMEMACKEEDSNGFESARSDFALDFLEFKRVVNQWKSSLEQDSAKNQ